MNKLELKVLGVCQAQGNLLLPLKRYLIANIEPRACFHSKDEEQWKINFGEIPFVRNSNELSNEVYKEANIIIGSPNCGASSILSFSRKKSFGKPKEDDSIKLFLEITKMVKPMVFFMENLPKLLDFIPKEEFMGLFPEYSLVFHQVSVSEFGNSQESRVRLIIVGVKKSDSRVNIQQFKKVFKVRKLKLTKDILNSLKLAERTGNIREDDNHKVCMYDYRDKNKTKLDLKTIRKLWVNDFKQEYKWPIHSPKMRALPGVYRNNENKYPMTARKADRQFRPDGTIMSPAELAAIQGFPKRFKIYHSEGKNVGKNYWINKGRVTVTKCPPYEIGIWFKKCLLKKHS